jgi:hypothetical protein
MFLKTRLWILIFVLLTMTIEDRPRRRSRIPMTARRMIASNFSPMSDVSSGCEDVS